MDMLTNYSDARANDANHTTINNYEKKHGITDEKPIEQKLVDISQTPSTPSVPTNATDFAKLMQDGIQQLCHA